MNKRLKKLALITEQLASKIPDSHICKKNIVSWLNTSRYSPYVTLYGGEGSRLYDETESFISSLDGKKRYTLKDNISFKFENFVSYENNIYSANTRLYNVIDTENLFEAYPEFKNIDININITDSFNGNYSGSTHHNDGKAERIEVYADNNHNAMRVLLHELQHCIQLKEGFALGKSYYNEAGVMDLFVGSTANSDGKYKEGSFSDIATKSTMVEIGDGNARLNENRVNNILNNVDKLDEKFEFNSIGYKRLGDEFELTLNSPVIDLENNELPERLKLSLNIDDLKRYFPSKLVEQLISNEGTDRSKLAKRLNNDESDSIYRNLTLDEVNYTTLRSSTHLGGVLEHDRFYDEYSRLGSTTVRFDKNLDTKGSLTFYNDEEGFNCEMYFNPSKISSIDELKEIMLHETQHLIQNYEGWARGGSVTEFEDIDLSEEKKEQIIKDIRDYIDYNFHNLDDDYRNAIRMINSGSDVEKGRSILQNNPIYKAEYASYLHAYKDLKEIENKNFEPEILSKYEQYKRLWGEQQARAVQYRMNMSEEERLNESWTETLARVEGEYNEPIVKYGNARMDLFGGESALEKDASMLDIAKELDKRGQFDYRIWEQTGWFKDRDSNWKFEINDKDAELLIDTENVEIKDYTLSEVLSHDKLFEQYPELNDLPVSVIESNDEGYAGMAYGNRIELFKDGDGVDIDVLLHEVQHIIQDKEGFARGGTESNATRAYITYIIGVERSKLVYDVREFDSLDYDLTAVSKQMSIDELVDIAHKDNLSTPAKHIFKRGDWYEYKKEVCDKFGYPPKRKCWERDNWIRDVAMYMASEKRSEMSDYEKSRVEELKLEKSPKLKNIYNRLSNARGKYRSSYSKYESLDNTKKSLERMTNYEMYKNLLGEAEARNVEARRLMSDEERRDTFPSETMDVRHKNTIVYGDGYAMSDKSDREANFKEWFGDSKVVDDNGEPLVVYHGTGVDFSEFNTSPVSWVTPESSHANNYSKPTVFWKDGGDNVMPLYINIKNPYPLPKENKRVTEREMLLDMIKYANNNHGLSKNDRYKVEKLKSLLDESRTKIDDASVIWNNSKKLKEFAIILGFDGYKASEVDSIRNKNPKYSNTYAAFEPTQIKSIHNNGAFDPNNPNILEKNDYGLRQIDKVLSILPNDINTSTVKDYLEFNGITHEHLRGTIYNDCLNDETFTNPVKIDKNSLDFESAYYQSAGEIESREIENKYINQSYDDFVVNRTLLELSEEVNCTNNTSLSI